MSKMHLQTQGKSNLICAQWWNSWSDGLSATLKNYEIDEALLFCNAISSKMKHRNKLRNIADRPVACWDIVEEYKVDPFASHFDDGKKIRRVENRALCNLDTNNVNNSTFINSMSWSLDTIGQL